MKAYFFASLMLLASGAFAQDTGRMETDRPDQTESPYITKRHYIQAEVGFNFQRDNGLTTLVHPTVLWKYGVSRRFEFRAITELNSRETPLLIPQGNEVQTGLLPVKVGGKLSLWEEKGLLPKTSVIGHVAFPKIASKAYRASKLAPEFRLTMQHTLSDVVSLGYNFGPEWDGEGDTPAWIYTFAPGFNLGKRGYMYLELFGDFSNGMSPTHNFDGGLAWYASDHVKLDVSSGFNLKDTRQYYVALGVSFRFKAF